ncbi:MAG: hypothetical protein LBR84_06040 [Tannerella sp.]|jgi:hypothetical protein|nr:hypothetical protein [Tannerella sp.]
MRKYIFLIIIGLTSFSTLKGQIATDNLRRAFDKKDFKTAESILKDWESRDAENPELYVAYFNFYTLKSLEKDSTKYDKQYAHKALDYISKGIEHYPTRFDMRLAKLYMYSQLKYYQPLTTEVIKLIEYSKQIDNNWKREDFRLLDNPDKILSGSVLDFQETLFATGDTSLYKNVIRISDVMIKYYPDNVQSYLTKSTVYVTQKAYDKSLEVLLKAKSIEPSNAVLLYNIAEVYKLLNDKDNAKRYFELTVRHATDKQKQLREEARKQANLIK